MGDSSTGVHPHNQQFIGVIMPKPKQSADQSLNDKEIASLTKSSDDSSNSVGLFGAYLQYQISDTAVIVPGPDAAWSGPNEETVSLINSSAENLRDADKTAGHSLGVNDAGYIQRFSGNNAGKTHGMYDPELATQESKEISQYFDEAFSEFNEAYSSEELQYPQTDYDLQSEIHREDDIN